MADDSLNLEVVLSARTQGLQGAEKEISLLQDVVDAANRKFELTPQVVNRASSSLEKMGGTASKTSGKIRSMAPEFQAVHKEVTAMNAALREQAQIAAARGSQTPTADAMQAVNFNEKDAKLVERYNEAMRTDGTQAARQFRTSQEEAAKATQIATGAIQQQEAHLPRLRYALHDVSNQLLIIGGAMTAFSVMSFKAAIDYERSFANVIRTNDSLMNSQVAANRMFQEFIDLAGEIPTSFGDLSEIGQLAGQLDIPTHALRDFTEAVAMFSATTGESIDTTATAFGRLDALLPGVEGNFQALGSSILNVGINSVATEGEIIKITTQLAGIGSQAGLTYDELVGLSGALASVGIQPELSRGTITRLFGQISRAVTTGGERLEEFGRIAGTTGDNFANTWASAPMDAVIDVLQGLDARGGEAEASLRAVGITSVRDVPAILRLAQTVDSILVPALGDAADGAEDATQLSENYGVIAETVASKLQILANNFQSLIATMGGATGPMAALLDAANGFLTWARELMDNPVTAFMAQLTVVVTGLAGVTLVLLAGVTRAAAGILAFRTAMAESGVTATGLRAQLTALIGTIAGVDAASVKASGNMGRLTTAMRTMNVASVALLAVPLLNWLDDLVAKSRGAVVDVNTLSQALTQLDLDVEGSVSQDISNVINQSLESLGSSTQTFSFWESTNILSYTEGFWRRTMGAAESEFDMGLERLTMKASSWATTDLFTGETSWLGSLLDPTIDQIEKFEEAWIQAWETASSETQKQAILDSLNELQEGMSPEEIEAFRYNLSDLFDVMGDGVDETALMAEQTQLANEEFESLQDTLMQIVDDVFSTVNAQYALSDAMSGLGEEYVKVGAAAAFSGDSMQSTIKTIVEQSGSAGAAAANLQVLYDFILQNSSATAGELIYLANAIKLMTAEAGGRASSPTLSIPDFNSFAVGVDRATASLSRAGSAGRGAGRDTSKSMREARKEVRTLTDYAGDLEKVWSRAFDIRFSGQSTLDQIKSTFHDIREAAAQSAEKMAGFRKAIEDSRRSIRSLKADIQGLQSDVSIQEYFLSIAVEYGDTERAASIEANLAKLRADLADKTADLRDENDSITKSQKDLNKEQDANSKTLTGNSQAAIKNRETLRSLVQQYQSHLGALAASGMSQADLARATERLRQDFLQQATQLGYNRQELGVYAKAFDDVTFAISKVPRNITVKANTNPAQQAFNEMRAAATRANSSVSNLRNNLGRGFTSGPINTSSLKGASLSAERARLEAGLARATISRDYSGIIPYTLAGARSRVAYLKNQGYSQGGFTGQGGKYEPAGVVHRGEYVIPKNQVNQATGLPYADALGRLMTGVPGLASGGATTGAASTSGAGTVALTAGTIQAIAQAVQPYLVIDNQVIAQAASSSYAQSNMVGAN